MQAPTVPTPPSWASVFALIRNGASWTAIGTALGNVGAHGGLRLVQFAGGLLIQAIEHWGTITVGGTSSPTPPPPPPPNP